ncbi:hypothetical protein ACFE04_004771 [Oxalis oulophora]
MDLSPTTSPIFTKHNNNTNASSSGTSFPIIAIAIIGILATAFLLVSYYIFVIKCCLNWHRIDILRRFSLSRRRNDEDPLMVAASRSPAAIGLDESVIRLIPLFQFKKETSGFCECAVCLNEFQENEKLRKIPNCNHSFHIDCIDVWLQRNSNCPICRNSISINPFQNLNPNSDYIVIELDGVRHNSADRSDSSDLSTDINVISPCRRKIEQRNLPKKLDKVTSMGDECINNRVNDEEFVVQPIRRSFSMDSSSDRQLYLAVQEIIQKKNREITDQVTNEGSSSSSRVRRNFFSFGHHKGSRSASVLPVFL